MMRSRFAAIRVRVAHRDYCRQEPLREQWLLIEWPTTEKEPTKYWLSNLPATIALRKLVAIAKLRWRIERDYEELKQELGLGHFEGRNWRGFDHHATLSIAAYGFLVLERCLPPLRQLADSQSSRNQDFHTHCAIRLLAPRRYPCAPNGITLNPSPPCAGRLPPASPALCHVAHVVFADSYGTVVLDNKIIGWTTGGVTFQISLASLARKSSLTKLLGTAGLTPP
jgi:hypothetical protein